METKNKKKLLFICAGNVNRSPTFENYFKKHLPQFEVKSCGIYSGFPEQINRDILKWADVIYVMDLSQKYFIYRNYNTYLNKVKVIGISDQYNPNDRELIDLIKFWLIEEKI